jgi:hypothetical protein
MDVTGILSKVRDRLMDEEPSIDGICVGAVRL